MRKNYYEYRVPLIEYCSALCAAGKTEAIINRTVELAGAGEMVIIAQLTIALLLQTAERLREKGVFVLDLHSENTEQVGRAVYNILRTPMDTGHVLLITHQCLFGLRDIPTPYYWHLFIDKTPQIHRFEVIKQPLLANELTDYLEVIPLGPKLAALAVTNWNAIRKLEENGNIDTGYEDLGLVAKRLRREWLAWVDPAKYQQFIDGNRTKLELMLMVSPSRLRVRLESHA